MGRAASGFWCDEVEMPFINAGGGCDEDELGADACRDS